MRANGTNLAWCALLVLLYPPATFFNGRGAWNSAIGELRGKGRGLGVGHPSGFAAGRHNDDGHVHGRVQSLPAG